MLVTGGGGDGGGGGGGGDVATSRHCHCVLLVGKTRLELL